MPKEHFHAGIGMLVPYNKLRMYPTIGSRVQEVIIYFNQQTVGFLSHTHINRKGIK